MRCAAFTPEGSEEGREMSYLAYYLSLGLLIILPRLAFWSGVFSTPSSL